MRGRRSAGHNVKPNGNNGFSACAKQLSRVHWPLQISGESSKKNQFMNDKMLVLVNSIRCAYSTKLSTVEKLLNT